MGENILTILNNENLTQEEKDILLKKLAEEYIREESKPNKIEELIEKNRQNARENRAKIEQINYNSSLKEQMEILAYLKNNNGENQFSKSYLLTLRGSELMQMYAECMQTMPEAMEKAKEERANDKAQGINVFDDYKVDQTKVEVPEEPKDIKETGAPSLEDTEPSISHDTPEVSESSSLEEDEEVPDRNTDEPNVEESVGLDLESLANKMTEEEMNYILDVQKIALESNVSLKEAEKMYMAAKQKDVESEEREEVPEKVEVPTPEKVEEKEPETKEQTSNRVKVKSLDMIGVVLSHDSNDLYKVQIDGQDGRSIVEVPASDLEIVDVPEEVKEKPITDLKPEDVDVEAKPGLKDTMNIPSPEMREALKVSEEPEEKPRKVVTKIVNKITEPFKKAINKGKEAIDNFFRKGKEEVPSEEELKEGYAKEGLSEEEIMKKATPADASKEEYSEAYKNADVSKHINNGSDLDFMNKR